MIRRWALVCGLMLPEILPSVAMASEEPDWQQFIPQGHSEADLEPLRVWLAAHGPSLATPAPGSNDPLVVAIGHRNCQALDMLLTAGASTAQRDRRQRSPTMVAIEADERPLP